jgi:carboxymethylenebutenolidase
MWPDVAGLRPAFEQMAKRLAGEGFAVLLVNPYYRSAKLPLFQTFAEWQTESGKEKIKPMREELTAERVASDGRAFVTWLTRQPEVDAAKKLGTAGYCMSGPFTFHTAAAAPNEVRALASFHGGGLVTAEPTSPHQRLQDIRAAILVCIAENDDQREPNAKVTLRAAAEAANVPAEIEVYPAQHGFCVIDSPVYSEPHAERAWTRLVETFRTRL